MKKILLSSIILFLFSASIVLFQISCKKEAKADAMPTDVSSNLGVILYGKRIQNNTSDELWTANYDGSNQKKLDIPMPQARRLNNAYLSPDGKIIILDMYEIPNEGVRHTYSCFRNGSEFKEILTGTTQGDIFGVY